MVGGVSAMSRETHFQKRFVGFCRALQQARHLDVGHEAGQLCTCEKTFPTFMQSVKAGLSFYPDGRAAQKVVLPRMEFGPESCLVLLGELEDGIFSGRPVLAHGDAPAREGGRGAEDLLPEGGSGSEGQHHVPLEHLDLRGNRIGVHGANLLATFVQRCPRLHVLDVGENSIPSGAALLLLTRVALYSTVTTLRLGSSGDSSASTWNELLGEYGVQAVRKLASARLLEVVDLSGVRLGGGPSDLLVEPADDWRISEVSSDPKSVREAASLASLAPQTSDRGGGGGTMSVARRGSSTGGGPPLLSLKSQASLTKNALHPGIPNSPTTVRMPKDSPRPPPLPPHRAAQPSAHALRNGSPRVHMARIKQEGSSSGPRSPRARQAEPAGLFTPGRQPRAGSGTGTVSIPPLPLHTVSRVDALMSSTRGSGTSSSRTSSFLPSIHQTSGSARSGGSTSRQAMNSREEEMLDEMASLLRNNNSIRELSLAMNDWSAAFMGQLLRALQLSFSIESLDVHGNRNCEEIVNLLRSNGQLHTLNLADTHLGTGVLSVFQHLQSKACKLSSLNVSFSLIGDLGASTVKGALRTNKTLRSLNLSGNHAKSAGSMRLSFALMENTELRTLKVNSCLITDEGARSIANALQTSSHLERLHMADNCISEVGIGAGSSFLEGNASVTFLDLSQNQVRPQTLAALQGVVERNRSKDKRLSSDRLHRELWRLEYVASKLPTARLEKERVLDIRAKNQKRMRELKRNMALVQDEGKADRESLQERIAREVALAEDTKARIQEASTELGAFRAKYDEEKLTMGDQYKATMEKKAALESQLANLRQEVRDSQDMSLVEEREQAKVDALYDELHQKEKQIAVLRKQVRLVKDFSVHQFETGSTTSSVSSAEPSSSARRGKRGKLGGKAGAGTRRARVSGLMASLHT